IERGLQRFCGILQGRDLYLQRVARADRLESLLVDRRVTIVGGEDVLDRLLQLRPFIQAVDGGLDAPHLIGRTLTAHGFCQVFVDRLTCSSSWSISARVDR